MSKVIQLAVAPYLSTSNEVISLQSLGPLDAFKINPVGPTGLPAGAAAQYDVNSTSVSVAVSAGFESLVSAKSSTDTQFFLINFVAWADPVDGPENSAIVKAYYGAGFRIAVKAWSSTNKVEANLGLVAAQSTLGIVASSYELKFFGIDLKHLGSITPFIGNNVGNFDATAMEQLGSIMSQVSSIILATGTTLRPALLKVDVKSDHPSLVFNASANMIYALRCMVDRKTITEAITGKPSAPPGVAELSDTELRRLFGVWGINDDNSRPSKDQSKKAAKYLFDED